EGGAGLRARPAPRAGPPAPATPGSPSPPPAEWNRLDARDLAYHQRVAAGFAELISRDPRRWRRLSAEQPVDALADQIFHEVEPALARVARLEPQR
ncbi:MAG TPA: hypothetical protein PKD53_10345, partial [Chloroflexaceae bacterium]|nr:hypothetical protein [Chloroflexaceae bacterium]